MKRIVLSVLILAAIAPACAQRSKLKKVSEPVLPKTTVEQALATYDFASAEQLLEHQIETLKKNKQSTAQLEAQLTRVHKAQMKLNAVERVTFIDSMIVPRNQVLDYIHLSPECGMLYRSADFFHNNDKRDCTVFKPQMGDQIVFAQADRKGIISLYKQNLFSDGTTSEPVLLKGLSDNKDSQNYPFMLTDGTTIYFAAQGEESLGGYDIFMSRYDADERRFLAPENIGMPFNSMANDYLFAIDEVNNLGWFVTDRNTKADKVCIYVFIPNERRQTYTPEDTDSNHLRNLARINSIRGTWYNQKDVNSAQQRLREAKSVNNLTFYTDFDFIVNNSQIYHKVSDFQSPMARQIAEKWLENRQELQKTRAKLHEMRISYHKDTIEEQNEMAPAILHLEAIEEELVDYIKQQEKEMRIAEVGT